jgi:hypothetical protein
MAYFTYKGLQRYVKTWTISPNSINIYQVTYKTWHILPTKIYQDIYKTWPISPIKIYKDTLKHGLYQL